MNMCALRVALCPESCVLSWESEANFQPPMSPQWLQKGTFHRNYIPFHLGMSLGAYIVVLKFTRAIFHEFERKKLPQVFQSWYSLLRFIIDQLSQAFNSDLIRASSVLFLRSWQVFLYFSLLHCPLLKISGNFRQVPALIIPWSLLPHHWH